MKSHSSWQHAGRVAPQRAPMPDPYALLRRLIWAYVLLWVFEGALRRWFLPFLAGPLLFVRDPIALAIYALAISRGIFPLNKFTAIGGILASLSLASALTVGHGNVLAALYGVRCDFFFVPMIFIMGRILRADDVARVAKVGCILAIPYTALLLAQFYSPQSAWVNQGLGGSLDGAGFSGAMGRFRPPGTFSFIAGPSKLYPLITACWFYSFSRRLLTLPLLSLSAVAILAAIPLSISRSLFLSVAIVGLAGVVMLIASGRMSPSLFFRFLVAGALGLILLIKLPFIDEALEVFKSRWDSATGEEQGGVKTAIVDRYLSSMLGATGQEYSAANFSGSVGVVGLGTGYSTNVGQVFINRSMGFGASEYDWGRILFDNGYFIGGAIIAFRVSLFLMLIVVSVRRLFTGAPIAIVFAAAAMLTILNGQWMQTTILGAAIIGAGITLAASHLPAERRPLAAPVHKIAAGRAVKALPTRELRYRGRSGGGPSGALSQEH